MQWDDTGMTSCSSIVPGKHPPHTASPAQNLEVPRHQRPADKHDSSYLHTHSNTQALDFPDGFCMSCQNPPPPLAGREGRGRHRSLFSASGPTVIQVSPSRAGKILSQLVPIRPRKQMGETRPGAGYRGRDARFPSGPESFVLHRQCPLLGPGCSVFRVLVGKADRCT